MDFYNQSHFLYSHISPSGNASLIDLALVSNLPQLHKCLIVPPLANSDHSGLEMSIKCREDTRATNCEAGTRDQRTSSYLHILVGVAILSRTSVFLASYFTQNRFRTFLHKHNTYTPHSGQDLRTRSAYGRA